MSSNSPTNSSSPSPGKQPLLESSPSLSCIEIKDKEMAEICQELVESHIRYAELYDQAPVGYLTLDEHSKIREINLAAVDLIGEKKSDLIHRPFQQIVIPEDSHLFIMHMEECMKAGLPAVVELSIKTKAQEVRPVQLVSVPVGGEKSLPSSFRRTMIIDIRQRKEAEENLKKLNETLEQQIAERTAIAEHRASQLQALASELTQSEQRERRRLAQILHDNLQQILVSARMRVNVMKNKLFEPSQFKNDLEHVDELLCSSIQASRTLTAQLSPPILYDAGLFAALEWLSRSMLKEYDLHIEVQGDAINEPDDDDVLAFVFQSVREFLFNCIKHADIDRASILTRNSEDGTLFTVSVEDNGKGFDPALIEANRTEISGFGLFSIRERLTLLGGRMNIDSAPGRGTCISLYIPLKVGQSTRNKADELNQMWMPFVEMEPQKVKAPLPSTSSLEEILPIRVLLADDHKILREGLAGLLRAQPDITIVGEAADGLQAIELARKLQPDLVVMDVSMPEVNGIEATRHISREMPQIKIIGLSMHDKEDMARAMFEAGAMAYITKGAAAETLSCTIRNCMNQT